MLLRIISIIILVLSVMAVRSQVIINEVMPRNLNTIKAKNGGYHDWIELKNTSSDTVDLEGWYLSDDPENISKWEFPKTKIKPNGLLLIWASGRNLRRKNLHANFKISAKGDYVVLSKSNKDVVDILPIKPTPAGYSYGREPKNNKKPVYFKIPTPNNSNHKKHYTSILEPVEFSHETGYFTEGFNLELSHQDSTVAIYYTTDGSTPDENSRLYREPIEIEDVTNEPNVLSMLQPSKNSKKKKWAPPLNNVYKGNVVRAVAIKDKGISPKVATKSFFVDENIYQRYNLPIISFAIDKDQIISKPKGIFTNYKRKGVTNERKTHMSIIDDFGNVIEESYIGLRVHGASTRINFLKNLRIYFRKYYGKTNIDLSVFNSFDKIPSERFILRNGNWPKAGIRDPFAQELMREASTNEIQGFQPAVIFINGEYWGILNIRQRFDDNYFKLKYGAKNLEVIKGNKPKEGSKRGYNKFIKSLKTKKLHLNKNYREILKEIDIDNFIDYFALQIFAMNTDQPVKNTLLWRARDFDFKWRWEWFDLDDTFGNTDHNNYDRDGLVFNTSLKTYDAQKFVKRLRKPRWAPNTSNNTVIFRSFIKNELFRIKLINRLSDLLNTVYHPDFSLSTLDSMLNITMDYQFENHQRWHYPKPTRRARHIEKIKTFLHFRGDCFTNQLVDFFKLDGYYNFSTHIDKDRGSVKVNSINISSKTPGVFLKNDFWTGTYFSGIPITLEAKPKEGYEFSHWEGDFIANEKSFTIDSDKSFYLKPVFIQEEFSEKDKTPPRQASVFNSPFDGFAVASFSKDVKGRKEVSIRNYYGLEIYKGVVPENKFDAVIEKLPIGFYTLCVQTKYGKFYEKFSITQP